MFQNIASQLSHIEIPETKTTAKDVDDSNLLVKLAADSFLHLKNKTIDSYESSILRALRFLQYATERKNIYAQFAMACFYENGIAGILPINDKLSLKLYQLAADQGLAGAQFNLGLAYEKGSLGLNVNPTEALRLYQLAADHGHAEAQNELACIYENGELGLDVNPAEALRLYQLAVDKGLAAAQCNLALAFENGKLGLDVNPAEATRLYRLAADHGDQRH